MSTVIFPLSAQRGVLGMGTLDKDTVSICQTNTAKYLRIRVYKTLWPFQIIYGHRHALRSTCRQIVVVWHSN